MELDPSHSFDNFPLDCFTETLSDFRYNHGHYRLSSAVLGAPFAACITLQSLTATRPHHSQSRRSVMETPSMRRCNSSRSPHSAEPASNRRRTSFQIFALACGFSESHGTKAMKIIRSSRINSTCQAEVSKISQVNAQNPAKSLPVQYHALTDNQDSATALLALV